MDKKKLLPIALVVLGIFVLGIVLVVKGRGGGEADDENANLRELTIEEKPFVKLVPKDDGHWLKLSLEGAERVKEAKTLEYELLYKVPGGTQQGIPGKVEISGNKIERDLLLGSESSGKFRYDEGVEEGSFSIRYRNGKGKLIAKVATDFHLQKDTKELSSLDNKFKYTLDSEVKDTFIVTMNTIGLPKEHPTAKGLPYGIFASGGEPFPGTLSLGTKNSRYDGVDWRGMDSSSSPNIGVFIEIE